MTRPLKIVIAGASLRLSDRQPFGEGIICSAVIDGLLRRGHALTVLAPQVELAPRPNLRTVALSAFDFIGCTCEADFFRAWYGYAARQYVLLDRLQDEWRPDVVHQLMPAYPDMFSWLPSSCRRFVIGPISYRWDQVHEGEYGEPVTVPHGPLAGLAARINWRMQRQWNPWFYRRTLARAAAVLLQFPGVAATLPLPVHERAVITRLGTDTQQFTPSAAPSFPLILYLGRLATRKGLGWLLAAMPRVAAAVPGVRLDIHGAGPGDAQFRAQAAALGERVRFGGNLDRAATAAAYREHAVYCLPSLGDPSPMTVLEAMACGRAVVGTNAGGIPEFVAEENRPFLVPLRDPRALAEALIALLHDPARAAAIGAANRRRVEQLFTWDAVIDRIEEGYAQAM
ncbi:MAG TPA: glycosyltransferase family 4 protein, partial [bacterium]|nr:glycosyltransferase family 4 protein [bacterium]